MKIFLAWDFKNKEIRDFLKELKSRSHKVVYLMGNKSEDDENLGETIFHNNFDAWHGRPALALENENFPPVGEDIIGQMHRVESMVMSIMNRIKFGDYGKMCVNERKHCYYNLLSYWHGVLTKYKPDVIIFLVVPHVPSNYILYELARLLKIKTICFDDTWVSDRLLTHSNFWEGSQKLQIELEKNRDKKFTLDDLSEDLRKYYLKKTKKEPNPFYMKAWKKRSQASRSPVNKLRILFRSIINLTLLEDMSSLLKSHFRGNVKTEYLKLQGVPEFSKKYIYAPLHYQPEKTTSPLGGIFVDQVLMIETLSFSMPADWVIYVKEHPRMWLAAGKAGLNYSNFRYKGYYERIAKLKNVRLVPIETDTFQLIDNAQAVATVSGTAGWEAVISSKPALVFGYPWYQDCPCIFRVNNVQKCRDALKKIEEGFKISSEDLIRYLKSFDQATIHCILDNFFDAKEFKLSEFSAEEQRKNFFGLVIKEIEALNN